MPENNASMSPFPVTDLRPTPRREQLPVITAAGVAPVRPGLHVNGAAIAGVAAVSAALLMTELALTRIFSVTMYYHFAFLAISIALFGLSASGVAVYLLRRRLASIETRVLLAIVATAHALATLVALACLVRMRVGLNYSRENLELMLAIYALAALPFFTGGGVMSVAFSRMTERINVLYAADLIGAAAGCLALIPLLNWLGAPGVVIMAAGLSAIAAVAFAPAARRRGFAAAACGLLAVAALAQTSGVAPFDLVDTKGHVGDRVLFSKWNSFSRVAVYDRPHGDWSLSPTFAGARAASLFMDIDSAASTPILKVAGGIPDASYLRYELTAIGYHLAERKDGFNALVIGPGGGRDLLSALVFGASHVDGVEINPIIARDVMLDHFRDYSGGIYANPRVTIHVDDGRNFVRRSQSKYDVIQASLVDTWAATAAGAYTLTENSLYTKEAFGEYLDHLTDDGVLSITRWVFDGLRLVSLAQEACAERGLDPSQHLAIVRYDRVATFLLKRQPFTPADVAQLRNLSEDLGFVVLYAPGVPPAPSAEDPIEMQRTGTSAADYRRLILASNREQFLSAYPLDESATTDDRPFFFHTTRLRDQLQVAFGRSMLFGNGLSALMTLIAISAALVVLFVIGPLLIGGERPHRGWGRWLMYFGALGAGFMLLEVALLQRFVLLLGHPVYSLTVTLFSLLLGTGLGSLVSRRVAQARVHTVTIRALVGIAIVACGAAVGLARLVDAGVAWTLPARIAFAVTLVAPVGFLLGMPMPGGMRLVAADRADIIPWGWGINGAFSVVGATLAVFIAMNWGFSVTLLTAAAVYTLAALTLWRT
jgi:Spermine/spermidine synthase domain